MEPNIDTKMEEFFTKAEKTLDHVTKATNLFKWLFGAILAIVVVFTVDTRVTVVQKADAQDVVYKRNAFTLEQLRLENSERNFAVFADTTCKMDIIKQHNENYMWYVQSVFDVNYRGKK